MLRVAQAGLIASPRASCTWGLRVNAACLILLDRARLNIFEMCATSQVLTTKLTISASLKEGCGALEECFKLEGVDVGTDRTAR